MVITAYRNPYKALLVEFIIRQGIHDRKTVNLRLQKTFGIQIGRNMLFIRFIRYMEIAAFL